MNYRGSLACFPECFICYKTYATCSKITLSSLVQSRAIIRSAFFASGRIGAAEAFQDVDVVDDELALVEGNDVVGFQLVDESGDVGAMHMQCMAQLCLCICS